MIQEILECVPNSRHSISISRGNDPVVPLEAILERGLGQIRTPHPSNFPTIFLAKEIGFGVITGIASLEDVEPYPLTELFA